MSLSRRALLKTGAASIIVLGAGGSWMSTLTSRSAREPWSTAGQSFGDPRLDALAYAILAPNPHNMQPWQVRMRGTDGFTLSANLDRLLPETDPPSRQITIGFGAFLELFRQAAAEKGFVADVSPFPEGEPWPTLDARPVAFVRLKADTQAERDPLFAQALHRHTQRIAFDTKRTVSDEVLGRIVAAAGSGVRVSGTSDQRRRDALRELTSHAWIAEWEDAPARGETVRVTRVGKAEVGAQPWGITIDGPLMTMLGAVGVVSAEAMDTPGSTSYKEGLKAYLGACQSAMAHVWSTTSTNTRMDQLSAGAAWVRIHQAATAEGVAFHPLSQALQEFPSMASHYADVHDLLADPGHTVQMLARLGYAPAASPAPREPLTAKLLPV
ncbi:MAG: twin-arginine translocation pathway signal protein [Pseudomonadota bacterium]